MFTIDDREITFQEIIEIIFLQIKLIILTTTIGFIIGVGYVQYSPSYTKSYIQSLKILFTHDKSDFALLKTFMTSKHEIKSMIERANIDQNMHDKAISAISNSILSDSEGYLQISIPAMSNDIENINELLTKLSKNILKIMDENIYAESKFIDHLLLENSKLLGAAEKNSAYLKNLIDKPLTPEQFVIINTQYLNSIEIINKAREKELLLNKKRFFLSRNYRITDVESTMIKRKNPFITYLIGAFFGFLIGLFGAICIERRKTI